VTRRLLLHSDSLCADTGFAGVVRTIVSELRDWEIDQVGINHPDALVDHDHARIYSTRGQKDHGGQLACNLYLQRDYDLMLIVQDLHVGAQWARGLRSARVQRARQRLKKTPIVFLFPVDGPMLGFTELVDLADCAVTCTRWGRQIVGDVSTARVQVVPHDVDVDAFRPLGDAERARLRRSVFNVRPDVLTVLSVAVNTIRKDLFQALQGIAALKARRGPVVKVHFHTSGVHQGMNLQLMASSLGLVQGLDYQIADPSLLGAPREIINELYNASDAVLFTSRREGWGLPMTEAMAAGTAVVAPRYGPFEELLGDDRGFLHEPAGLIWTDKEHRGPCWLSDPEAVADQLELVLEWRGTPAHQQLLDRARAYVGHFAPTVLAPRWRKLLYDVAAGQVPAVEGALQ